MSHTIKVWVEAFRADGSQILGNGDGQGAIHAAAYRRTNYYKQLKAGTISKRPAYWRIVTEQGLVLGTIARAAVA